MELRFVLCPECQEKYSALRFDPAAPQQLCIMPLCAPFWFDEHPNGHWEPEQYMPLFFTFIDEHKECLGSIVRLASARTQLWRTGAIPEELKELWEEAQRLLPDWPGFKRLSRDPQLMESLDGCEEELAEVMGFIREEFPNVATTNDGGGLSHFTASRRSEEASVPPNNGDNDD
jgi:hypothetical protein